jgi:translation initiation factor IF-2
LGKPIKQVLPGEPGQILGFSMLPPVGAKVISKSDYTFNKKVNNERPIRTIPEVSEGQVPVIIKASSTGSLEAVLANLPEEIIVIHAGVGDVTENDIFLAKTSANTKIITFEAKVPSSVKKLADTEGITIETFSIIYELFDKLEAYLKEGELDILGKAQVLAVFPFSGKKVAGCKVTEGVIKKGDKFLVKRDKKEIGKAKAASMKREKKDIDQAKPGEELGILFDKKLDFEVGDMIISVR